MSIASVSIIIPCYKAAATLARAVQSALQEAPASCTLLLVEDGSPDDTGALCDALAAKDPRITALHRPNGGAGAARNTGLDHASGDWVLFLDADDELLPGFWAALAALPDDQTQAADLILFGMTRQSGPVPCPLAPGLYPTLADLGPALDPLLFETGYLAAPYPKLFRRAALGGLRFEESLKINEDVLFNLFFLQKAPAIYCASGVYYKQNDGELGSLSRSLRGDLLDAEAITRPALQTMLQNAGLDAAPYLQKSRVRAAINQYGLLTGQRGAMPFAQRRALFARILADTEAHAALQARLRADPNRLLALPYRLGVALCWPGWLAAYTQFKNRFLP